MIVVQFGISREMYGRGSGFNHRNWTEDPFKIDWIYNIKSTFVIHWKKMTDGTLWDGVNGRIEKNAELFIVWKKWQALVFVELCTVFSSLIHQENLQKALKHLEFAVELILYLRLVYFFTDSKCRLKNVKTKTPCFTLSNTVPLKSEVIEES